MGLGRKMCKWKVFTGYYSDFLGEKYTLRCKNPNAPAKEIMQMDSKKCCRRLCPYYESK